MHCRLNYCIKIQAHSFYFLLLIITIPNDKFLDSIIIGVSAKSNNDLSDLDLYKIVWKGPWTDTLETNFASNNYDHDNVINVSTNYKEHYRCIVPNDDLELANFDSTAKNQSSSSADSDKADQSNKSPIKVLEPLLKSNYCSYKYELFWIYELCHGKFLRQYHEENAKFKSKTTQEYYLGKLDAAQLKAHEEEYERESLEYEKNGLSRPTILVDGYYKPYIRFNMTGGTKCDLTKSNRISRIIYVCNEESKHILHSIKEISTCEYEAIVLSPSLCQHKDFKGDSNTLNEITCYSLEGSPNKPTKLIEADEEDDNFTNINKRKGIAYFHGKTFVIEADSIFN